MRCVLYCSLLLVFSTSVWADDDVYQILRQDDAGYGEVVPGKELTFPRDHLPHPDYRIEWWYLTANLTDSAGRDWGVHWTLFRQTLYPQGDVWGWNSNQVWMAHAAVSTPNGHVYEERFARGGIGQAGVDHADGRFEAWLDDWLWRGQGLEPLPGQLSIRLPDISVDLRMTMATPWVLNGDQGFSQKSAQGQASYYYSQPHIQIVGVIGLQDQNVEVNGVGWLDREWSSQPLADNQPGWDWISLHLNDGSALMVYRLRHTAAGEAEAGAAERSDDWISGTWTHPDGTAEALSADDIRLQPLKNLAVERKQQGPLQLPLVWSLALPAKGSDHQWVVRAPEPDHWLETSFPYWEGPVIAEGVNPGVGYLELTGY